MIELEIKLTRINYNGIRALTNDFTATGACFIIRITPVIGFNMLGVRLQKPYTMLYTWD